MSILTEKEIGRAIGTDRLLTSEHMLARAIEAAVLEKLKQQEPVAWQDTAKPSVILEHDQLDPMWQPIMRPLYAAPVPAAAPDQWGLVRKAVGLAIEACKNATGQRRKIDLMVSGNQITHDVMGTDITGLKL